MKLTEYTQVWERGPLAKTAGKWQARAEVFPYGEVHGRGHTREEAVRNLASRLEEKADRMVREADNLLDILDEEDNDD